MKRHQWRFWKASSTQNSTTLKVEHKEVIQIFDRHELEEFVMSLTPKQATKQKREEAIKKRQEMENKLERTITVQFAGMKEQIDELRKKIAELKSITEQTQYEEV